MIKNKRKIAILLCVSIIAGILIYLRVTYRENVPVKGIHKAYLIDRTSEEVISTTYTEIDGYISGYNEREFIGDIDLFYFGLAGLPDFQITSNNNFYSFDGTKISDSLLFGYNYAFVLTKDMQFSAYVIGISEEFDKDCGDFCVVANASDEDEALNIYRSMKTDIEYCYNLLGKKLDTYKYRGTIKDADGNEIDIVDITINGVYFSSDKIAYHCYGELIIDGYYESGYNEDTCFVTEYTPDVVFVFENKEGVAAEIYGNPFEGENITIKIKESKDNKISVLYEITCNKK